MTQGRQRLVLVALALMVLALPRCAAQICYDAPDLDAATRSKMESAARQYFDYAARGDLVSLRQSAIASVASDFGAISAVVLEQKASLAGTQPAIRAWYLLEAPGNAPLARAQFYCGIYNSPQRVVFVLTALPPGRYAVVIQDLNTSRGAYSLTLVLKQEPEAGPWKLAGYYSKPSQYFGHDGNWFLQQARQYKARGQWHNAWMYYLAARDLLAPVNFMGTPALDRMYDEQQQVLPGDLPLNGPVELAAGGKTFQVTQIFPVAGENGLLLVVRYKAADVSNTQQALADNMAVIKSVVSRYPEYREAFAGVVARAVEPSGRDYGSLLAMKDVK